MPTELANYVQRVLVQPLITPASGRSFGTDYMRDTAIRVLVQIATERLNVPFSRNRASKRPSACYLVSGALGRRGYSLGERRIEKLASAAAGPSTGRPNSRLKAVRTNTPLNEADDSTENMPTLGIRYTQTGVSP